MKLIDWQHKFFLESNAKYNLLAAGRRTGKTQGAAKCALIWAINKPVLWVDTVYGNIDRYYQRYFIPAAKELGLPFTWNVQKKILEGDKGGYIDFRSADRPENIEGFGYQYIVMNEAGIILKNDYLYTNSILPMLIDYPDSKLFAIGTPKGKINKDGSEHRFYQLWEKAENDKYFNRLKLSTHQNPLLDKESIRSLEEEMSMFGKDIVRQEIYADFIDNTLNNPFATAFDENKHVGECYHNPNFPIIISIDFNVDPFCAIFAQEWNDQKGHHLTVFDEVSIPNGSIPKMIDYIKEKYGRFLHMGYLTGDYTGKARDIGMRDNLNYYQQLMSGLKMNSGQLKIRANQKHSNSRADINYLFTHHQNIIIDKKCKGLIRDLKFVQWDGVKNNIMKSDRTKFNQSADLIDGFRYLCANFMQNWIARHQKTGK